MIGIGCMIWSLCAVLFALSSSLAAALPSWALAGASLALIVPNAQSIVADYHTPQTRGRAFGVMHLSASAGGMIGALLATNIGEIVFLLICCLKEEGILNFHISIQRSNKYSLFFLICSVLEQIWTCRGLARCICRCRHGSSGSWFSKFCS